MAGLLVELVVSWVLLWFIQKESLRVLGLSPRIGRLKGFFLLFCVAAACSAAAFGLRVLVFKERYEVNPLLDARLVWEGFRWNLVSVLYEELLFRGALLYILARRLGTGKALVLSAVCFGVYHWFSYGLFGNAPAMIQVFLVTGIMGWILAFSYTRTGSLYPAIGLHLGWNFTNGFVLGKGSIGNGVLMLSQDQPVVTVSYLAYYTVTLLPIIAVYLGSYFMVRHLHAVIPEGPEKGT